MSVKSIAYHGVVLQFIANVCTEQEDVCYGVLVGWNVTFVDSQVIGERVIHVAMSTIHSD